jgi:hypothetical protein
LETSIEMADAVHNEPEADLRAYEPQAADAQHLHDESEEQHHKSQNDSNATQPERAEDLALQIASGKVSKKSFFERFTVLWAQRYLFASLAPHSLAFTHSLGVAHL